MKTKTGQILKDFMQAECYDIKLSFVHYRFYIGSLIFFIWLINYLDLTEKYISFSYSGAYYTYKIATLVSVFVFLFLTYIKKEIKFNKIYAVASIICMFMFLIIKVWWINVVLVVFVSILIGQYLATSFYIYCTIFNNREKFYIMTISVVVSNFINIAYKNSNNVRIFEFITAVLYIFYIVNVFNNNDKFDILNAGCQKFKKKDYFLLIIYIYVIGTCKYSLNYYIIVANYQKEKKIFFFFVGVILGIVVTLILKKLFYKNLTFFINVFSSCLLLGIVCFNFKNIFINLGITIMGIAYTIGMINIFYIVTVEGKKCNNKNYNLIFLVSTSIIYLIYIVLGFIPKTYVIGIDTEIISAIWILIIIGMFIAGPLIIYGLDFDKLYEDLISREISSDSLLDRNLKKYNLTPKEIEVAKLLLDGCTMRQTSAMLSIATSTVNTYCTSIYRKMNINSRTELLVMLKEYIKK